MSYWIFVVTDPPQTGFKADKVFDQRMEDGFWGLSRPRPPSDGDRVVFFVGGRPHMDFRGTARLAGEIHELTQSEKERFSRGYGRDAYGVYLEDIRVWPPGERPLKDLKDDLQFIRHKGNPGASLQGQARVHAINEEDWQTILVPRKPTDDLLSLITGSGITAILQDKGGFTRAPVPLEVSTA